MSHSLPLPFQPNLVQTCRKRETSKVSKSYDNNNNNTTTEAAAAATPKSNINKSCVNRHKKWHVHKYIAYCQALLLCKYNQECCMNAFKTALKKWVGSFMYFLPMTMSKCSCIINTYYLAMEFEPQPNRSIVLLSLRLHYQSSYCGIFPAETGVISTVSRRFFSILH